MVSRVSVRFTSDAEERVESTFDTSFFFKFSCACDFRVFSIIDVTTGKGIASLESLLQSGDEENFMFTVLCLADADSISSGVG